jgi:CubicO group peptidase (beta-lactamase class C family)
VSKFVPEFDLPDRQSITIQHLLTHVSGLPDQLPENRQLRQSHAPLSKFVEYAVRTPLLFAPGQRYSYSSMGILLCAEIAERIGQQSLPEQLDRLFEQLDMRHSVLGLGRFSIEDTIRCQVADAAAESGAGHPSASGWDWNSQYWRRLGAPWGGVHASASDVGRFLAEFLYKHGKILKPETCNLMIRNHNPQGLVPRGLGFALGRNAFGPACSDTTFGHTGSTGTIAWADTSTDAICVVLTSLPSGAAEPHPRLIASDEVARQLQPDGL